MRRSGRVLAGALLAPLALGMVLPTDAFAHTRSTSYSSWRFEGERAEMTVRASQYDLSRLGLHPDATPDYARAAATAIAQAFALRAGNADCTLQTPAAPLAIEDGWISARANWACARRGEYAIESRLLFDVAPQHLHFARVRHADGLIEERVLSASSPAWTLAAGAAVPPRLAGFLAIGFGHILSGWDHLAFLVALLLLASRIAELVWLATGFTLAHSLTLALAVLGVLRPSSDAIEALIALTIVLAAAEFAWQRAGRGGLMPWAAAAVLLALAITGSGAAPLTFAGMAVFAAAYFTLQRSASRPAVARMGATFAFGLFHGFGFAGVMLEMDLPAARLAPALLGFNLGVEAGQLLVIAVAWPLLRAAQRRLPAAGDAVAATVAGLGIYWFVVRTLTPAAGVS